MMPKPENRARKTAFIFLILFAISVISIFIPSLSGMDMMSGGYAIAFVLFFLSICFLITCIVFFGMARRFDAAMAGNQILAHWEYPRDQWLEFVEKEYVKQRKEKWALFYLVAAITFVVVVIFAIVKRDSWLIMIIIFFSLTSLLAIVAFLVPVAQHANFKKAKPQTFITNSSAYLSGEFHCWNFLGAKLESADFNQRQMLISLTYSYPTRAGRSETTVRIPVPPGAQNEAGTAVKALQEKNSI